MYAIVGLGNFEKTYDNTYHNVGFLFLDYLSKIYNCTFSKEKYLSAFSETKISDQKVVLLKPKTFMNLSGKAVQEVSRSLKIKPENIIIVYDDFEIGCGLVRFRKSGSGGTHNGMKNIISLNGSQDFPRLRIGTNSESFKGNAIDFVLSKINKADMELIQSKFLAMQEFIEQYIKKDGEVEATTF